MIDMWFDILNYVLLYAFISVWGGCIMSYLWSNRSVTALKIPPLWLYYLLSFTWGLPINLAGGLIALVLRCKGYKPKKYGPNYCFELPVNFGLDLGIFFIAPINGTEHTKNHELGHSIQNVYYGPFGIGMVYIPSMVRFHYRNIMTKLGRPPKTFYDDAWFEGQASASGNWYMANKKQDD